MKDPRLNQLAKLLVNYSIKLQKKEKILVILYGTEGFPLLKEVYRECIKIGAYCTYELRDSELTRIFFENADDHQINYGPQAHQIQQANHVDAMIQILADRNNSELMNIDQKLLVSQRKSNKLLSDVLHKKRWVLFEYPTLVASNNAKMSTEAWEDFVFNACLVDWESISKEQDLLKNILLNTKEVRLVADETDLVVNIEKQPWVKCNGTHNMPDGEVFTSPIKNSVNGTIKFNTPTQYMGKDFEWIKLTFENGKVIQHDSNNNNDLKQILDVDKGARYLGEFAFGTNKMIQKPVKSILFDEKIGGSNHMALGKCYDDAPNGNDSSIHWDLILRHKEANGKVYFDGVLSQSNGIWLHPELTKYN